jgi:histidinol-phosphate aminotransferase
VIAALQKKNVYIGRIWPVWPNAVRVTVGTSDEMAKFKVAFKDVMDNSGMASSAPRPSASGYGPIKGSTFLS